MIYKTDLWGKRSLDNVDDKDSHCLMYADDIVLLSRSAKGLHDELNMLNSFCKDWFFNKDFEILNKADWQVKQKFTL